VACESSAEAHYVCAVLNSAAVNQRVAAHSVRGGKGFGTPGMLEYIPLAPYRANDPRHVELAALSRQAHAISSPLLARVGRGEGDAAAVAEVQHRIDELVSSFADFQWLNRDGHLS
jgi:hypothetical protein